MNANDRRGWMPYRMIAVALALVVLTFGLAVLTGYLEVRRPSQSTPSQTGDSPQGASNSKCYIQRVKIAENLLKGQNVQWVYKFGGGLPKCWSEVDSEGNKQTLGPWISFKYPVFSGADPLDRPLPESIEGYVALFGPSSKEQTYRLVCAVTKAEYPKNPKRGFDTFGFREVLQASLPELAPAREQPNEEEPRVWSEGTREDGEERRFVQPGGDEELNFLFEETPAGKDRSIRLWLRFFTEGELAAAGE